MQVYVHDTLKEHKGTRQEFVMKAIQESLERFHPSIQRVDASLSEDGHTPTTMEYHCKLSANVSGLGVIASDAKCASIHEAVNTSVEKLVRGIEHKIGHHRGK